MNSETRVPEERVKRVTDRLALRSDAIYHEHIVRVVCEYFARDLSEDPIVPTDEQFHMLFGEVEARLKSCPPTYSRIIPYLIEWQRRMFRAEEDVPEALRPHWKTDDSIESSFENQALLKGYRLGQKSR